jgi:branched-chain amino acid transport system substrate-binding protein
MRAMTESCAGIAGASFTRGVRACLGGKRFRSPPLPPTSNLRLPMLLPGITVSTSADDFAPIKQMQLQKFDGATWRPVGEVVSGSGN